MDNVKGLLGIRRMDRVPNERTMELCGVTKGVNERIDEGVLRWFGHVERTENAKRLYLLVVSQWVGYLRDGLIS